MYPYLFTLPFVDYRVPTYGVLLAITFLTVLKVAGALAARRGIEPKDMIDVAFAVFLAGLLGAKLLLVILDLPYYLENPAALGRTAFSAGVFYGGLLLAIPAGVWMARRRGLPLWTVADITAVCLPVGLAVGRLGCFAAGCCWGTPSDLPWAVTFTDPLAGETTGVPLGVSLHPTQIYLSLNAVVLTAILLWRWSVRRMEGEVFLWFVVLYGLTRSFWETMRGDTGRGFLIPHILSTSQTIGLVSALVGVTLLVRRYRAKR